MKSPSDKVMPTTEDEWTIHTLNIHGNFFEMACQQAIKDSGNWQLTTTEYPLEVYGHETALDIRADTNLAGLSVTMLIECKKNNPEFTEWVFFPKREPQTTLRLPIANVQGKFLRPFSLPSFSAIADVGRETKSQYSSIENKTKTKTSNAAIYDAAKQVSIATSSIWTAEAVAIMELQRPNATFIIPVIVTTARLSVCNFDVKDVDKATGEIPFTRAHLSPVDRYIVYEFPLPPALQSKFNKYEPEVMKPDSLIRRHILIVQADHFEQFLQTDSTDIIKSGLREKYYESGIPVL